jgi:alpha-D-ribose 1-methylphosphonate 5-triphosphate diphosphatase PhnM
MKRGLLRVAAAVALSAVSVTSAQAACWNDAAVSAAKVRDLETMLMVSALRCRASDNAMLKQYNRFVVTSRSALASVNQTLRDHFAGSGGLNAYDRYVTSIANRYGAGADGLGCDDMTSILSAAEAEGGSLAGLTRLANDAGVEPRLSGERCAKTYAAAR